MTTTPPTAEDLVTPLCADLLRIDTSNYGDGSGPGERKAAEHVAGLLTDAGLEPELVESEPGRASVVARWAGADPSRPALLLHGHLDVVPAVAEDWRVHPFSGEVVDGELWGRGAVDMKDMDAMVLANVLAMTRRGERPARDVVLAFLADEEAGGMKGARHLVETRRELFDGVTEAVSEVGGFSLDVDGTRAYLLQTAEKGILWLRLVATGRPGHGSQVHDENAVSRLAAAVARIGGHRWPFEPPDAVRAFAEGWAGLTGRQLPLDDPEALEAALGTTARWVRATTQNTATPTVLDAGYKHNVVPGRASALVDCRFLPGQEETVLRTVRELAGEDVAVEVVHHDRALETSADGSLVDAMTAALQAEDPGSTVLPYCLSGGTDNKHFDRLGIRGFGFAPLRLPDGFEFAALFHGTDERVPVDALRFGARTLGRFLTTC
ncbi:M20/M25/M40 family metallo-hydrolase [Aquipuribacter nitratireducens]|uniref:M20/M25/M40 family metallo-hydrolase n=1 Tax=Aquipuribacter nitratireducens TaxID=650104 RepID=A0ABW0GI92_9MICO